MFGVVGSRVFLYDSHYCSTDRTHDPTIAACATFGSGIRVYDIRNPYAPQEIAYYNPGLADAPGGAVANANVGRPVIRSDLRQIWFADIAKGFYTVQFRDGVWPFADQDPCPHADPYLAQYDLNYKRCRAEHRLAVRLPAARACNTRRSLAIRLRGRFRSVAVKVRGKRVKTRRKGGRLVVRGLPRKGRYRVRVIARTRDGRRIVRVRRYRACVSRMRAKGRSASLPGFIFAAGIDAAGIPYYCRTVVEAARRARAAA